MTVDGRAEANGYGFGDVVALAAAAVTTMGSPVPPRRTSSLSLEALCAVAQLGALPLARRGGAVGALDLTVALPDGRQLRKHVEHAVGSVEAPMSDAALKAKFAQLADGVLPAPQARRLLDLCWRGSTLKVS